MLGNDDIIRRKSNPEFGQSIEDLGLDRLVEPFQVLPRFPRHSKKAFRVSMGR